MFIVDTHFRERSTPVPTTKAHGAELISMNSGNTDMNYPVWKTGTVPQFHPAMKWKYEKMLMIGCTMKLWPLTG